MSELKYICLLLGLAAWSTACSQENNYNSTVSIRGATFLMGTNLEDIPALRAKYGVAFPGVFENESPAHSVTLKDFRLDQHEVTYALFAEFLKATPEWRKDRLDDSEQNGSYLADWQDGHFPSGKAQHPVVYITWAAAQSFCRWNGGRLPTEAEWEFAARSGGSTEFPWGDILPTPELANYSASGNDRSVVVGSYPPNDFGVYDLAGNVWEFLLDEWTVEYRDDELRDPVHGGFVKDEDIRRITGRRAVRGASFGGSVVNLRTRWRDSHVVTNAIEFVGFRCSYVED